ncbi:EAL domain-containing protein [Bacillus sp. 31A1R]|uniref:EAL domain-containing protein n=1 Tax=Robertmurraya mangrovi TaxID=3098077 RepID=A0ABU5IW47_9BACI|nr:EAL domain-containing protein [Bacillus sp. 31A1R]MDZ5471360.1 EAL domain-containing protein [Bacillus sp. 31A1R]
MLNIKQIKMNELFLLAILIGLVLFCSAYNLTFVYGITFTFTSVFLFLILRLYGLPLAILSGLSVFLVISYNYTNIAYSLIFLTELIFVGAFFTNRKKAKMFFVDALYWLTFGLFALITFHWNTLQGAPLYFEVSKVIINGLFNVLMADMLLAYFPFYHFIKKINKNSVSIHQFLSHLTFISILVPFFLSVAAGTWNAHEFNEEESIRKAKSTVNHLNKELERWNKDDLKHLHEHVDELNDLVLRHRIEELDIIIIDENQRMMASTNEDMQIQQPFILDEIYELKSVSLDFLIAVPKDLEDEIFINQWSEGFYLYKSTNENLAISMIISFPISQYQMPIFNYFLDQLQLSLLFAVCLLILVQAVSRIFMRHLEQLTTSTTGLPQKLSKLETITWPQAHVSELRLLTQNLMKMADKLKELFRESNEMNEKLQKQTNKLRESEDQLHHLAYYDILTNLPNRLHFQEYVKNLIETEKNGKLAIIFIDLNQFKQINDTLGHDAGDELLQMAANRLSLLHDDKTEIFRLGGDEFVIVNHVENRTEVEGTINKILEEFQTPFPIHGQSLYITSSVGVSMYPNDGKDLNTLVKSADIAMYISKENGGNVAQFFDDSMRNRFKERLVIENALRAVVDRGGFALYYQPKTQSGIVTSMEALLRWHDPELGSISPATFIPIAEEIGLILPIDEWALVEACKQNKKWQEEGLLRVPVSVNLSAKHFQQDYLSCLIEKALNISGLDPKYLKLEITESVFIKNPAHVAQVIEKIKRLGVLISIDDFGKGYSSLYQLLQLPIDEIKIDRQFISNIDQNERKALLVKSILEIAKGLSLNVVAEGIETEEEKMLVEQIGAHELQGYFFSPPVSHKEMMNLLNIEIRSL